jgi:GTP 3',8-cyclase
VRKLRLTGGEPLVRRGIMTLFRSLSRHLDRRARRADAHHQRLAAREIRRRAEGLRRRTHQRLARHARSGQVPRHHPLGRTRQGLAGIDAAQAAGLKVKINAVALKGVNEDELGDLVAWAHGRGMDLTSSR